MHKRVIRISAGVVIGISALAGMIWLLSLSLGNNHETLYAGKTIDGWLQQLDSHEAGASNQAYETLTNRIIPALVDQMFYDTNDSKLRLSLITALNGIPGVQIDFIEAEGRRIKAADALKTIGPPAKVAVPSLIQVLKDPDSDLDQAAIRALGGIHSNPDVIIPLLIPYLTNNDDLTVEAVTALGNYGSLAREAFPKMVPIFKLHDWKDGSAAARVAMRKIDPEAAAKAGVNRY